MANLMRGEIEASVGGKTYTLCLTLGALAELESALAVPDMLALAERFESGRLKARDAIMIIGAGLRGAGHDISDEQVAAFVWEEGMAGCIAVVAQLLQATFSTQVGDRNDGQG